jgi:hypothetical protein
MNICSLPQPTLLIRSKTADFLVPGDNIAPPQSTPHTSPRERPSGI